ncbi:MAG: dihydrolipoamide acetyltransferase family protein [Candidatus Dormibacteraceae bacterium]
MSEVNMPKLSDTMEEGSVLEWKRQDGDQVKKGDVLAEIETDKASFEIEAEAGGVLEIVAETGRPVPVGGVIARIGTGGERAGDKAGEKKSAKSAAPEVESRAPAPSQGEGAAPEAGPDARDAEPEATDETAAEGADEDRAEAKPPREERPARPDRGGEPSREEGRVKASPVARRLAGERGVDLATLEGSGPGGRIVKEDVLAVAGRRPAPPSAPEIEVQEPSRMQAAVARRMAQSKATVPHFYLTVEARVDEAVRMRRQLKETVPDAERVTVTDMLVRACALALRRFPTANASWVDGHFEIRRRVNIGIAVAIERGLIVPVLEDADRKDLVQISIESRQLIERARAGKLSEGDLSGGTFSISNLGMFGVDEFSAIVNPPEAAILAVGAIKDAPVVVDGRLEVGKVMRMTVSVDHRVLYGADAAQFLAEVKRLLENPVSLVLPPQGG